MIRYPCIDCGDVQEKWKRYLDHQPVRCDECKRLWKNHVSRKWTLSNPEGHSKIYRRHMLKKNYGMTPDQYEELLHSQGGGCAVCGRTTPQKGKRLPVDHDHVTGKVRGILCSRCNVRLGEMGDDLESLDRYYEKFRNYLLKDKDENLRSVQSLSPDLR